LFTIIKVVHVIRLNDFVHHNNSATCYKILTLKGIITGWSYAIVSAVVETIAEMCTLFYDVVWIYQGTHMLQAFV